MGWEYIIGAILVVSCLAGVCWVVFGKIELEPVRHPGQPNADADPGPKPAIKKKPQSKELNSSDWDGDGSN